MERAYQFMVLVVKIESDLLRLYPDDIGFQIPICYNEKAGGGIYEM